MPIHAEVMKSLLERFEPELKEAERLFVRFGVKKGKGQTVAEAQAAFWLDIARRCYETGAQHGYQMGHELGVEDGKKAVQS